MPPILNTIKKLFTHKKSPQKNKTQTVSQELQAVNANKSNTPCQSRNNSVVIAPDAILNSPVPKLEDTNESKTVGDTEEVKGAHAPDIEAHRSLRPWVCPPMDNMGDELFPQPALNTPIGALRKSRRRLSLMLNIEQVIPDGETLAPDYTGLAEMLGFDTIEIQNFWEQNPCSTLFTEWARCPQKNPFLWRLVECLEALHRHDVLQECCGLILEDVSDYITEQNLLQHYAVGNLQAFDCYVNIADEDLMTVGRELLDTLEGVYGLRLCLTLRDVALGGMEFENMAQMLETRCHSKTLIVLSKHFANSDACQFLTHFAVTLDPGAKLNKLIPLLVDEDINIPRVLRCLAIVHYHRDKRLGFLWPRLVSAIKS